MYISWEMYSISRNEYFIALSSQEMYQDSVFFLFESDTYNTVRISINYT